MDREVQILSCVEEGTGLSVDIYSRDFEYLSTMYQSLKVIKDGRLFEEITLTQQTLKKHSQNKVEIKRGRLKLIEKFLCGSKDKFEY